MRHPDVAAWMDYLLEVAHLPGLPLAIFNKLKVGGETTEATIGMMLHFRDHSLTPPWQQHWSDLRKAVDRAIVLTRRNELRRILSKWLIEQRTAQEPNTDWGCRQPRSYTPSPIAVNLQQYLRESRRSIKGVEATKPLLAPYHAVTYEDLCADWSGTMRGVYDYLQLEWNDPQVMTHRQELRPVREIVSNWDKLIQQATKLLPNPDAKRFLREADY